MGFVGQGGGHWCFIGGGVEVEGENSVLKGSLSNTVCALRSFDHTFEMLMQKIGLSVFEISLLSWERGGGGISSFFKKCSREFRSSSSPERGELWPLGKKTGEPPS